MTKKSSRAEVNLFNAGINTEASPLNFPPTATKDEQNFELNKNGTRERRLGIDYEANHALFNTGLTSTQYSTKSNNTFKWDGAGGSTANAFIVVQLGQSLHIFDAQVDSISGTGFLGTVTATEFPENVKYSFAAVDGILNVVSGEEEVFQVSYNEGTGTFSTSYDRIKVRDLWGVQVTSESYETDPMYRGVVEVKEHIYNLRNQSWAIPRRRSGVMRDPIFDYFDRIDKFPSNSESIWTGMTFSGNSDPPSEIFLPTLMRERLGADISSARGFFVIDLLRRGNSRLSEYSKNQTNNVELVYNVSTLPEDVTIGGPTTITEFAGRVWFAGFGGKVTNGDARSPNLSSFLCFSQLVNSKADALKCYQAGDPTSRETSDIIDTDGGFIRISGANKIVSLRAIGKDLIVLADNGVWQVTGSSDEGFTATKYSVTRITTYGCVSPYSVVSVGDSVFYWSDDGIYALQRDQFGSLIANNLTQDTIQTLYEDIDTSEKAKVVSIFDPFDRKVRWLYNTDEVIGNNNFVSELVLNTLTGAFTKNKIFNLASNTPEVIGLVLTDPFKRGTSIDTVVVGADTVQVLADNVIVTSTIRTTGTVSVKYLTVVLDTTVKLTFSQYRNLEFKDWKTANGVGVDAFAYMLTGAVTAGDSSVHKQTPVLVMHMFRTEFTATNGVPNNQSGCRVRTQWDWASSTASGKWSPLFQAYRYRRPFFVTGPTYDNGFETVVTRNKVRGRGRAFSVYLETEPGKDCRIIGWNLSLNGNAVA